MPMLPLLLGALGLLPAVRAAGAAKPHILMVVVDGASARHPARRASELQILRPALGCSAGVRCSCAPETQAICQSDVLRSGIF